MGNSAKSRSKNFQQKFIYYTTCNIFINFTYIRYVLHNIQYINFTYIRYPLCFTHIRITFNRWQHRPKHMQLLFQPVIRLENCRNFSPANRRHRNWEPIHQSTTLRVTIDSVGQCGYITKQEISQYSLI